LFSDFVFFPVNFVEIFFTEPTGMRFVLHGFFGAPFPLVTPPSLPSNAIFIWGLIGTMGLYKLIARRAASTTQRQVAAIRRYAFPDRSFSVGFRLPGRPGPQGYLFLFTFPRWKFYY